MNLKKITLVIIPILIICLTTFIFANLTNILMDKLHVIISGADIINLYIGFFIYLVIGDIIYFCLTIKDVKNLIGLFENKDLLLNKLNKYQKEFNLCYIILIIGLMISYITSYFPLYCLFMMLGLSILVSLQILLLITKYWCSKNGWGYRKN